MHCLALWMLDLKTKQQKQTLMSVLYNVYSEESINT